MSKLEGGLEIFWSSGILFLLRKFRSRKLKPPTPCQNLHLFSSCSNLFFPRAFSLCRNVKTVDFLLEIVNGICLHESLTASRVATLNHDLRLESLKQLWKCPCSNLNPDILNQNPWGLGPGGSVLFCFVVFCFVFSNSWVIPLTSQDWKLFMLGEGGHFLFLVQV